MIVHRTTKTGRRARKHPCTIHHWYRLSHGDERRKISHTHRERERERKREFMNRKHTRVRLCHFTHSFILFLFYSISDKINHASALTLTYRLRKIRASKLSNAIDRDVCTYTMSLSLLSLSLSRRATPQRNGSSKITIISLFTSTTIPSTSFPSDRSIYSTTSSTTSTRQEILPSILPPPR